MRLYEPPAKEFFRLPNSIFHVPLDATLNGFEALLGGELDEYPESAFSMVGTVDEVREKARAQGAV